MRSNMLAKKRANHAAVVPLKGNGGERSEPEVPERGTTAAAATSAPTPDPEVPAYATRKKHSSAFKLRILKEADAAGTGGIGALLRREGLYSSCLTVWRKQREAGELSGLTAKKRGPGPKMDEPTRRKLAQLEKANSGLLRRLRQAEQIIVIQKKISELLGIPLSPSQIGDDD